MSEQPRTYSYAICVDFDATCWEYNPSKWRTSDVMEFPAVLVDLKTGKIESEFHKYIWPSQPTLPSKPVKPGVERVMSIHMALMLFHEWVEKVLIARNLDFWKIAKDNEIGDCAFITWPVADFNWSVALSAQELRYFKPPFFHRWIDLRAAYHDCYEHHPLDIQDALAHLELNFEGNAECKIDHVRNLAVLTYKIVSHAATQEARKDLASFHLSAKKVEKSIDMVEGFIHLFPL